MLTKKPASLTVAFISGVIVCGLALRTINTPSRAADAPAKPDDLAALKAELTRLKGMVPDQSHAMSDVGYHYSNLWFAG